MSARKKTGKSQPNRMYSPAGSWRGWPVVLIAGGILLVALAYFALRDDSQPQSDVQPQVTGAPAISVEPQRIDMGEVKLGTPVKASFVVTNIGDQALKFTEAPYIELVEGC